ncbi:CFI-box-CTERM domain-containing protein [Clostridium sp. BJN0013]|uniref:CFI-box-CTERM domain-containing protein n=1 Tax=Clostridium sp. BJN0013 TaxID=3236840 RepID=UPI0034C6BF75
MEVNKLRIWRDTRLKKSVVGRSFIKLYYQYGEKLSLIIKPHQRICRIIKSILDLFVKFL